MKILILILSMSVSSLFAETNHDRLSSIKELKRIAFSSCTRQHKKQPLWNLIVKAKPDLWIFGGDNVYADATDPSIIKKAYEYQNSLPDFKLFKSTIPFIGTWDDHDYGANDSGGHYTLKKISQQYFMDFMEEPANSPRRTQEGVQASYVFGNPGKKVKIIVLDLRYHKDMEPDAMMLGKKQWQWLEEQFRNSDASLHLVVSSMSFNSPTLPASEEWADYPSEVKRMVQLIKDTNPKGVLMLTGDKHFSDIFFKNGVMEYMSSGMTHNVRVAWRPYVSYKFPNPLYRPNFGIIDIDWADSTPVITLHNRTVETRIYHHKRFRWVDTGWKEEPIKLF